MMMMTSLPTPFLPIYLMRFDRAWPVKAEHPVWGNFWHVPIYHPRSYAMTRVWRLVDHVGNEATIRADEDPTRTRRGSVAEKRGARSGGGPTVVGSTDGRWTRWWLLSHAFLTNSTKNSIGRGLCGAIILAGSCREAPKDGKLLKEIPRLLPLPKASSSSAVDPCSPLLNSGPAATIRCGENKQLATVNRRRKRKFWSILNEQVHDSSRPLGRKRHPIIY